MSLAIRRGNQTIPCAIHVDEGTSVIIMCHSSSIEIALHYGSNFSEAVATDRIGDNHSLTTSRKIHWQLRLILECMRREFSWLKNMRYEMCICCPVCSQKGSPKCRSHDLRGCECLHLLSESELLKCQYCTQPGFRGDCRIRIELFTPWFTFSDPQESRTSLQVGLCLYSTHCPIVLLRSYLYSFERLLYSILRFLSCFNFIVTCYRSHRSFATTPVCP